MEFVNQYLLTILIAIPALGAMVVLLSPNRNAVRWTALLSTLVTFAASLLLFAGYNWSRGGIYGAGADGVIQLVQRVTWIPAIHAEYFVGIDGLSLPLVILSTFVCVLACIASWNIAKMTKGYFALFLLLESGILGVFMSLDFFLFYVFFELSLLPMYFLIGVWGGPRREYAAIKFFLYTLVGSIAMLIVMIALYLHTGTFDLVKLADGKTLAAFAAGGSMYGLAKTFFILLMVAFLIKVPAVPFHTWLPDAHVEAPTPISMILAALLLKMGGYGIFRIAYPLFPDAARHLWMIIAIVGVVSIIYGGLCAMAQTDFKKLVAYSSVSHMGLVTLGAAMMTPAAMNGALFMMVGHGITSAAMFFIVGVIYERAHHREIARLGGLANTMPVYTGFSTVAFFANLGLPGLCGFVGEVMVLMGTFAAASKTSILVSTGAATAAQIYPLAIIACFGVIISAAYMLWTIQRVFLGPEKPEYKDFPDLSARELTVITPLTIASILLGVAPWAAMLIFTAGTVKAVMHLLG